MRRLAALLAVAVALAAPSASAGPDDVVEARTAFERGADLAKDAQWGAALAAFEHSATLVKHPWTTYNIAVCERALGQYVRARRTFLRALDERRPDADLPEATVADVHRFVGEIDRLVATLDVTLDPPDAAVAFDGAPLEPGQEGTLLAGTLPAGPGRAPGGRFRVVLDPGVHVVVVSRPGFTDAVAPVTVRAGESRALRLAAEQLPATIRITSNVAGAVVSLDELDVGTAPVDLARGPGVHHVRVRKPGFDPYEVDANVKPGQRLDVAAKLRVHSPSVLTRWWFWTGAAVVVGGAAAITYAATRPDPQRPPVDGGGLGWAVRVP